MRASPDPYLSMLTSATKSPAASRAYSVLTDVLVVGDNLSRMNGQAKVDRSVVHAYIAKA